MAAKQLTIATRDVHAPRDVDVLHVDDIDPGDDSNPRYEREEMDALTGSVGRRGQLQNVNVIRLNKPDKDGRRYTLAAGRSRYASIRKLFDEGAGTGEILAIVHPPDSDARGIALSENLQRVQMKPGELAAAILEYSDQGGRSDIELAEILGIAPATVREYLRLADALPAEALRKLNTGALTKGAAQKLLPLAGRSPQLVEAVVANAGEGVASSDIAANPDLVAYEIVRDRRIPDMYAEPFTGGLDVLDVRDVIDRAIAKLQTADAAVRKAAPITKARSLATELGKRDPDERVAHVEPSDVHRVTQTAPPGAIIDLSTRIDDDGEVLSRAVVCTNPALMLDWAVRAGERLLKIGGTGERAEATLVEAAAEVVAEIKSEARSWNRTLAAFAAAVSTGADGCGLDEPVAQLTLGAMHLPGRLLVGQGLGHIRGDWRADSVAVRGGEIEERERMPLGSTEGQLRFEEELADLAADAGLRLTVAAVIAGALCDTREVGGRESNRQLRLPTPDDSPTGRMALAIATLAASWDRAPKGFGEAVCKRLDIGEDTELMLADPRQLKRRSRI